jgi:hypothetical protein
MVLKVGTETEASSAIKLLQVNNIPEMVKRHGDYFSDWPVPVRGLLCLLWGYQGTPQPVKNYNVLKFASCSTKEPSNISHNWDSGIHAGPFSLVSCRQSVHRVNAVLASCASQMGQCILQYSLVV